MLMNVQMDGGPTRKKDNMSNSGLGSTFEEDDENNTRDPFAQLQSLQSTFSLNRRARPPPINTDMDSINRIPLRKELQKRTSRFGLQGMFTRTKADIRSSIISPVMEETTLGRTTAGPSKEIVETNSFTNPRPAPTPVSTPRLPVTPAKPTTKPSRINLRSKSVKEIKVAPKASPKSSLGKTPTRSSAAWDPPPLFQAYPQAIKHATLSASTLSADSILRMSNHRRNNSIVDDFKAGVSGKGPALTAAAKKTEKAKNKHRRQLSGSISKGEWTRKIYVLVTSGYLLQYAADGSFDRLPEKMMQLGKDSVAFASDVIPGKHWVLQISQSMDADGTPTTDSRSLFSRLAFRGADYRRTATSFLLVLNSAEDLDAWIAAVRREIEALGGKKNLTELGKPKSEETVSDLKTQPSHRFLVQRESIDQFSNPSTPQSPSFGVPSWTNENLQPDKLADAVSAFSQAQAQAPSKRATDSHHSMTTMSSHDGHQLDALRESTNRFSHMSSGQRTFITTESSSPSTSPQRESFPSNYDETPSEPFIDDVRPRPNALAINERRRSMQVLKNQVNDPLPTPKFRPHSTYDIPPRPSRSKSPTPNFSVPRGSRQNSKSPNPGRTFRFPVHERPPVPTYVTQMPVRPRNSVSTLKSSQKAPPKAISVVTSSSRPSTSPKSQRTSKVMTPTETSFKVVPQARASVINIPPRSPSSQGSSPVRSRTRMPPMTDYPLNPPETLLLDFQFPRRVPSMQTLQEAAERSRSMRESTPPEAALSTPLPRSPYILGQVEQRPRSKGRSTTRASVIGVHPLPNLDTPKATPPKGLRRPSSMQYHPSLPPTPLTTPTSGKRPTTPNKPPFKVPTTSPPRSTTINHRMSANPLQRLREAQLVNRRSMPTLANGPPPAPPPDCALPPLPPPGSAGSMKSPGSSGSLDSMRV